MARPRHRAGVMAAAALLAALTACSTTPDPAPAPDPPSSPPRSQAPAPPEPELPPGWQEQEPGGVRIAFPQEWQERPAELRAAPDALLEVGVPYPDAPTRPEPFLVLYSYEGETGQFELREQAIVDSLSGQTDFAAGALQPVEVAGAVDAAELEATYATAGGPTSFGTEFEPVDVVQRELLVDVDGPQQLGLRYVAPADVASDQVWDDLVASLVVPQGPLA